MCGRLEQEYRIWLQELLEVLHELCEDVVPAARLGEDVYWRTKSLYRNDICKEQNDFVSELLRYAAEGREALKVVRAELVSGENKTEENIIRLRRENATAILRSLQFLVNFAFLVDRHTLFKEVSRYFEVDVHDGVKRVRSGVVVSEKRYATRVRQYPAYARQPEDWEHPIAG